MATTYSLEQAMAALGMSRNTLALWCKKCNIVPADHPYEKRVKLLTDAQVEEIRVAQESAQSLRMPRAVTPPPPPPASHLPIAPRPAAPSRAKKQHGALLPDGWVSLDSLVKALKLDRRSVDRDIAEGKIAVSTDGGPWYKPPNDIVRALDPDQQAAFRAYYAQHSHPS